jgi:glycosyltransferase involved in cell wall biosynthesis
VRRLGRHDTPAHFTRPEPSRRTVKKRLFYFVTEDWYFCSHRLPLAVAAQAAGYDVTLITRVTKHGDVIRNAGIRIIPFENHRGSVNPLVELSVVARLANIYRRERPDIVHHVAIKPVLYGSIAARVATKAHVINAIAGMGWLFSSTSYAARLLKPAIRSALRWALRSGMVIVQNPDDANQLTLLGVEQSRIRRIAGSGVDVHDIQPGGEPAGTVAVLLAARLLWEKGVGDFVAAARLLRQRGVDARFVVAGKPDERNPSSVSAEQLEEWHREGVVDYAGFVADMPALLTNVHIACLPSYYAEGIPKSLIEAAAAGLPIVTTNTPGCREIVRNGDNGLLVEPRNPAALAAALERLIRNPLLRRRMGERGRARAVKEFSLDRVVQDTLAIYAEASR